MSENQVIPEAAVEAAARQLFTQDSGEAVWGEVREAIRMHYREEVTGVLEAAAPHMRAEAWEQGMQAMYDTTSSEWPPIPEANPYRTTP